MSYCLNDLNELGKPVMPRPTPSLSQRSLGSTPHLHRPVTRWQGFPLLVPWGSSSLTHILVLQHSLSRRAGSPTSTMDKDVQAGVTGTSHSEPGPGDWAGPSAGTRTQDNSTQAPGAQDPRCDAKRTWQPKSGSFALLQPPQPFLFCPYISPNEQQGHPAAACHHLPALSTPEQPSGLTPGVSVPFPRAAGRTYHIPWLPESNAPPVWQP